MRRAAGVVLAVLVTLAVTACTGAPADDSRAASTGSAADFATAYRQATDQYQQRLGSIQESGQQAVNSGDDEAVLEVYATLRDASGAAADDLEDLDPPEELRDQRDAVVRNLRRQKATLDRVITAAQSRDEAALTEGLSALAGLLVDFATTHQAIDQELARGP